MIRRPPRSTPSNSSAASDVYKRQPWKKPANSHEETGTMGGGETCKLLRGDRQPEPTCKLPRGDRPPNTLDVLSGENAPSDSRVREPPWKAPANSREETGSMGGEKACKLPRGDRQPEPTCKLPRGDRPPYALDVFSGENAPVAYALAWCGWRVAYATGAFSPEKTSRA